MAKRKMRKFSDGGFSSAQEEWLGGADRTDPYILARMRSAVPDSPAQKTEFESATGQNKNIGDDVRERAMRSVMADDSPAGKTGYGEQNELPAPSKKTITKTSISVGKPAPTMPDEEKARMESLVKKQALERVSPETALIGGGGLKLLQTAGRNLASKIAGNRKLNDYVVPKLAGPKTPALPSPTPKLTYDKAGALAARRSERAAARDVEMKRGNAKNYGIDPDAPGSASALDSLRRNIGDGEFAMRKGGKVKAKAKTTYKSGGSVSSASKRADGCAIRGKTRA